MYEVTYTLVNPKLSSLMTYTLVHFKLSSLITYTLVNPKLPIPKLSSLVRKRGIVSVEKISIYRFREHVRSHLHAGQPQTVIPSQ
jgi:hypothetical protein